MTGPTLAELMGEAVRRLAAAGVESPSVDASFLAERAFGLGRTGLRGRAGWIPEPDAVGRFETLVDRRAAREPLQRILGGWEFWGLELALGPDTLIPRPDTETVVEAVLGRVPDRNGPWRLLDLGTGTGAILLALLSELPHATGVGVDRAEAAAKVAWANAQTLGLGDRTRILVGDWAAALTGSFDIIVSNPPYIPSADIDWLAPEVCRHEPRLALDGGPDGLAPYRRLAPESRDLLRPGGLLAMEHGHDQARSVWEILLGAGFVDVEGASDLAGHARVALARRARKKDVGLSRIQD